MKGWRMEGDKGLREKEEDEEGKEGDKGRRGWGKILSSLKRQTTALPPAVSTTSCCPCCEGRGGHYVGGGRKGGRKGGREEGREGGRNRGGIPLYYPLVSILDVLNLQILLHKKTFTIKAKYARTADKHSHRISRHSRVRGGILLRTLHVSGNL